MAWLGALRRQPQGPQISRAMVDLDEASHPLELDDCGCLRRGRSVVVLPLHREVAAAQAATLWFSPTEVSWRDQTNILGSKCYSKVTINYHQLHGPTAKPIQVARIRRTLIPAVACPTSQLRHARIQSSCNSVSTASSTGLAEDDHEGRPKGGPVESGWSAVISLNVCPRVESKDELNANAPSPNLLRMESHNAFPKD